MMTMPQVRPPAVRPPGLWPFLAWLVAGAGLGLGLASIASIGIFVLPVAIGALVALLSWRGSRNGSAAGVLTGLGTIPLYIAYLNRSGPGNICTAVAGGGQACGEQWNPWPFLAAGLLLVAGGLILFSWLRRKG